MTPHTNILLDVAGSSTPAAGNWFNTWPNDPRTHNIIDVVLSAGTATWNIEGRNGPDDEAVVLDTQSVSSGVLVAKFKQHRINVTAAAGATIYATIDRPAKDSGV